VTHYPVSAIGDFRLEDESKWRHRKSQIANHPIVNGPMARFPDGPMLFDSGVLLCEDSAGEFLWLKIVVLESS
jgi:hypothetical protein